MKKYIVLLFCISWAYGHQIDVCIGTDFNYLRMHFNNPSYLEGYAGGVIGEVDYQHAYFKGTLGFEGTWNAGPITGDPSQKSSIYEYLLYANFGPTLSWGKWQFDPYVGFGWDRFNNEQKYGIWKLSYLYDKLYIPIGYQIYWNLTHYRFGLQAEFRPDVYQRLLLVSIHLDPRWGYAFRTQLSVQQQFPFNWGEVNISFRPFFEWNRFGSVHEKNSFGSTLDIPRFLLCKVGIHFLIGVEF